MKGLHLSTAKKKNSKPTVAAPKKRAAVIASAPARSAKRYGVLMPEKLALANRMLSETPVPSNLFREQ